MRIAGIRQGRVSSVDLTGTVITVKFRLDDSVSVRSDATAAVRLITPIGGRVLDLDPGSGPTALSGAIPLFRHRVPTTSPTRSRRRRRCSVM
ncbi:MlaD family protein [Gordonia sp. Swx-4]|nr:MlaD family protein [Gordonia sp. Swx-4]WJG15827.1 MlaD family protein [Gordonia sp. Swx-4]